MNLLILKNDEPRDGPPRFDDCPHFSSLSLPLHRKMPMAIPKQYARAKSATPSENVSESIFPLGMTKGEMSVCVDDSLCVYYLDRRAKAVADELKTDELALFITRGKEICSEYYTLCPWKVYTKKTLYTISLESLQYILESPVQMARNPHRLGGIVTVAGVPGVFRFEC